MNITDSTPMIEYRQLIAREVHELNDASSLYTIDFRAISEDMSYDIPAMFKYENLLPWVVDDKYVTVNEFSEGIPYEKKNRLVHLKTQPDSRCTVYSRFASLGSHPHGITKLYVGIPHPEADQLAHSLNYAINYTYVDFLKYNDKIKQKQLFGQNTPEWRVVSAKDIPSSILENKYLKRSLGSGGYSVFAPSDLANANVTVDDAFSWFLEDACNGTSHSVQIYKDKGSRYTVFGFSEQIIEGEKHFSGAHIKDLRSLMPVHRSQIDTIINGCSGFLQPYQGFFGLDFILTSQGEIKALELNVRLTAMTIPTLVYNERGLKNQVFLEDVSNVDVADLVMTHSMDGESDIMRKSL